MGLSLRLVVLGISTLLLSTACYRGYKSAEDLEKDERGPGNCAQSCQELGLRMSAFILVEHEASGCVCEPVPPPPQGFPPVPHPPAAAPGPAAPPETDSTAPSQQPAAPEPGAGAAARRSTAAAAAGYVLMRRAAQRAQMQRQTYVAPAAAR
jgi:hypothetical protein